MNYALKTIYYLVGLLSSNTLPAVPLGSSITANHFSSQSTPTALVADAQGARPSSQVVGDVSHL